MLPEDISSVQAALLDWFEVNARRMPFRETRDPYAVWVSEIMLQQTTVPAATPYWERFMARFADVRALAEAPLDDVLHAWAGLGYYSRARNLHAAAKAIVERHGGVFPRRFEEVLALPGIGRYTAGAICSFAYNDDVPVVEANVARVLARVLLIGGDPRSGPTQKALWDAAARLLPAGRSRDWNLALFDLGATICVPVEPRCVTCPVAAWCGAFRTGRQAEFPQVAPKPPMEARTDVGLVLRDGAGRMLLLQRPPEGVWAGMWEVPRDEVAAGESLEQAARRVARERLGVEVELGRPAGAVRHTVMRQSITLHVFLAEAMGPVAVGRWVSPEEAAMLALPSPQRRLLAGLTR